VEAGSAGGALLLGPIGVLPECQGLGIGTLLMDRALAEASAKGHSAVILVGDAPYYERFGFSSALTAGLNLPGPVERERFQGLELVPGALGGATGMVKAGRTAAGNGVDAEGDRRRTALIELRHAA
jgi:predicted N-acetyltransferase YhbS